MATVKLDLTGLDNLVAVATTNSCYSEGTPLALSMSDIVEDPAQPRTYFSEESIASLAAQIQASTSQKIHSPISVKPINADGKYVINHGARRFRATRLLGSTTIPAFIEALHTDYDQVAENIQRENLSPLDIALFIKKRLAKGDTKGFIAAQLGQQPSFISEHLPLITAPVFIQELARDKRVGARTLYDLIHVHSEFPKDALAYVATSADVSRAGVAALAKALQAADVHGAPSAPVLPLPRSVNEQIDICRSISDGRKNMPRGERSRESDPPVLTALAIEHATQSAVHFNQTNQLLKGVTQPAAAGASHAVPRLTILVRHGTRLANIKHTCLVELIYQDTGDIAEVALEAVEVIGTEEQRDT